MNLEFSGYARRRMLSHTISEEDVLECVENASNTYNVRGDIVYVFHNREETILKVRIRPTPDSAGLVVDAFRLLHHG